MKMPGWCSRSLSTAVVLLIAGAVIHGETHYVTVDESGFSPAEITIVAGDTVQWENVDDFDFPHSTTCLLDLLDPDYWDYDLFGTGETFEKTFNNVGDFQYTDAVDGGVGLIRVNPPVVAPVINLGSPRLVGGQFLFDATGLTVGKTNVLFGSTNLTAWVAVSTNVTSGATVTFTNGVSPAVQFYRVAEVE